MTGDERVAEMLNEWRELRRLIRKLDEAMHPPVYDKYGRRWEWWKGELWRHCGMAWTKSMIISGNFGLPNDPYPNMCTICAPEKGQEQ